LWRLPVALEYFAVRTPDASFKTINGAGPETGTKRANGCEAPNSKLYALHGLNVLRE
jgi:hypothetical protein